MSDLYPLRYLCIFLLPGRVLSELKNRQRNVQFVRIHLELGTSHL